MILNGIITDLFGLGASLCIGVVLCVGGRCDVLTKIEMKNKVEVQ